VVNHHVPGLWCCSTHRPSPARRVRIYERPQASTVDSALLPETPVAS
jgi:hypothetical protein